MKRVVVIGTSGSGKSTLGGQLAQRLDATFIDPDTLHWQANWQETPTDEFRRKVAAAVQAERWVFGGNYSKARDLIWTRADTLIWLDYPLAVVFGRLLRRTIQRIRTQENLWNTGNRETWHKQFLSRDSLFLWMLKTHGQYRHSISQVLEQPEYAHLQVIRFRSSGETEQWFKRL